MCTGADFRVRKEKVKDWGEHDERGSEKKGRKVERSAKEESGLQHFICVELCRLQFSQVSDMLLTLTMGIPPGNSVLQSQKESQRKRQPPAQN